MGKREEMSTLSRIAQLLSKNEVEALRFCRVIQSRYDSNKPSFEAIADFLEQYLNTVTTSPNMIAKAMQTGKLPHEEVVNDIDIIDFRQNLRAVLSLVKNSEIDIAAAFASKTEDVIETILQNGNDLSLLIGTINHFTDPKFIENCRKLVQQYPRFEFFVDFRGDNSIHWKLYLIKPDIVVIGSPNLTITGLLMVRDTAIRIVNQTLHQEYKNRVRNLKQKEHVLKSTDPRFEQIFNEYKKQHRVEFGKRLDTPPSLTIDTVQEQPLDFETWVNLDRTQGLPIFISDHEVPEEDRKRFEEKIKPKIAVEEILIDSLYLIGTYATKKDDQRYHNSELLLMMSSSGAYMEFDKADVVVYGFEKWWLCGFENEMYTEPFTLTPEFKRVIKSKCRSWFNQGKTFLDTNDLRELVKLLHKQ